MKGAIIQISLDDLAKKLGLPDGVAIMSCEINFMRPGEILLSITGPGLPEVRGVLQVVSMITETRFE
jgi:hypothetical protein